MSQATEEANKHLLMKKIAAEHLYLEETCEIRVI